MLWLMWNLKENKDLASLRLIVNTKSNKKKELNLFVNQKRYTIIDNPFAS